MPTPVCQGNPRTLPTAVILALIVFGGCTPYEYRGDANAYTSSDRLIVPVDYTGPNAVFVRPLGIRRPREDGDLRLDVLIAGEHAFDAATRWASAAAQGTGSANAVISLRRTAPDATPLSLTFAGDRATCTPLDDTGRELDRGLNAYDRRIMLTFILSTSPGFRPGTYDVSLELPSDANAAPWDVGRLDIAIETRKLTIHISDTSRID